MNTSVEKRRSKLLQRDVKDQLTIRANAWLQMLVLMVLPIIRYRAKLALSQDQVCLDNPIWRSGQLETFYINIWLIWNIWVTENKN